jgi:hypothetical protein
MLFSRKKKREQRSRCLEFVEEYHIVFQEVKVDKMFKVLAGSVTTYLLPNFSWECNGGRVEINWF